MDDQKLISTTSDPTPVANPNSLPVNDDPVNNVKDQTSTANPIPSGRVQSNLPPLPSTSRTLPSASMPSYTPLNVDPLGESSLPARPAPFGGNRFGGGLPPMAPAKPKDPHEENFKVLKEKLGEDRIKEYESMVKHSTFRIGGAAEFYYEAENIDDMIQAINLCREDLFLKRLEDVTDEDKKRVVDQEKIKSMGQAPKPKSPYGLGRPPLGGMAAKKENKYQLPFFILGGGSNILVSDSGIPGLTIKIKASKINIGGDIVEAYAGTITGYLLQMALDHNLSGMEFLDGVPGTIGGAVYNNAKAFFLGGYFDKPRSISSIIYDLTVMTTDNKVLIKRVEDYEWHLTHNNIRETGDIILVVRLKLHTGFPEGLEKYLADYHDLRRNKPYMKKASAGSIFRNPDAYTAGKLIDDCGLKGKQIGDAKISDEHGNILLNLGQAKASEIKELIELCKTSVWEKFQIKLKEEVTYVGDWRSAEEIELAKKKTEEADNSAKNEGNSSSDSGLDEPGII